MCIQTQRTKKHSHPTRIHSIMNVNTYVKCHQIRSDQIIIFCKVKGRMPCHRQSSYGLPYAADWMKVAASHRQPQHQRTNAHAINQAVPPCHPAMRARGLHAPGVLVYSRPSTWRAPVRPSGCRCHSWATPLAQAQSLALTDSNYMSKLTQQASQPVVIMALIVVRQEPADGSCGPAHA